MTKKEKPNPKIPQHEIDALARCLLPELRKFFDSEKGQKEFREWKRKQKLKKENIG